METTGSRRFIRSYDDLEVFQRSMSALSRVHEIALRLPDYEKSDLANQLRRASKSIPATSRRAMESAARLEFRAFLTNALGSATEMQVHLKIAPQLEYIAEEEFQSPLDEYKIIARQLYRLIQHWRSLDTLPPSSDLQEPSA